MFLNDVVFFNCFRNPLVIFLWCLFLLSLRNIKYFRKKNSSVLNKVWKGRFFSNLNSYENVRSSNWNFWMNVLCFSDNQRNCPSSWIEHWCSTCVFSVFSSSSCSNTLLNCSYTLLCRYIFYFKINSTFRTLIF